MDDQKRVLFSGADPSIEEKVLVAEDEGGRDVPQLIIDEAEAPGNNGIVEYCWEDPNVDDDKILDSDGEPIEGKAPGDSLKISYVVDPFVYLGAPGALRFSGYYLRVRHLSENGRPTARM